MMRKLSISETNQDELNNLSSKMNEHVKSIQNVTKKYKNDLLLNESIVFNSFSCSFFGELLTRKNSDFVLSSKCGQLIRTISQHSNSIESIEVNDKSNIIISASGDKKIKILKLETGECLRNLNDHQDWVTCIQIISNNKFISGSCDKTIKIWDMNSFKCLNTLKNESDVYSLCLISNNKIACGCFAGIIKIWDLNSLTKIKSFKAHNDWISNIIFVDRSKLISCSGDKKIKIWKDKSFECIKVLEGHCDEVYYLDLTSEGYLLSCSKDKSVKSWNIETGQVLK
jgi:WD40 repeat protein